MKPLFTLILPLVLVIASCSTNVYKDKSFFSKTNLSGQTLAVLPAEVIYSGNLPKNWDADRIEKMEKDGSIQLQQEIHDDFLYHASDRTLRKKYDIKLIDTKVVNERLEKIGISLKDSWRLPSEEIAKIVGADMDLSLYHSSQSAAIVRFEAYRSLRTNRLPVYVKN